MRISDWISDVCSSDLHKDGLSGVASDLAMPLNGGKEPQPIRHLREYSNYLNPKLGVLSADSWTLLATYLRNPVLHWLMLLPPIMVILLPPKIGVRSEGRRVGQEVVSTCRYRRC